MSNTGKQPKYLPAWDKDRGVPDDIDLWRSVWTRL